MKITAGCVVTTLGILFFVIAITAIIAIVTSWDFFGVLIWVSLFFACAYGLILNTISNGDKDG
jgi:hypothetical protein